jgi:hypothetical protein
VYTCSEKNSAGHLAGDRPFHVRLCPRLKREDTFYFRDSEHEASLDTLPQGHGRDRTCAAGADQTELNHTVLFVEINELDVAAIAAKRRADILEDFLDLVSGRNG